MKQKGYKNHAGGRRAVYIGLGVNVGDRRTNLREAISALDAAGIPVSIRSSLYETEPLDLLDQADFLNMVVGSESDLPAFELLDRCLAVERNLGRVRDLPSGPRVIDLDLLLCGDEVIKDARLELPHPRMHLRRFVLVPLGEIAPRLIHPILKRTVSELLEICQDRSRVERLGSEMA